MQRAENRSILLEGARHARRLDGGFRVGKPVWKFLGEIGHDAAVFERLRLPARAIFKLDERLSLADFVFVARRLFGTV